MLEGTSEEGQLQDQMGMLKTFSSHTRKTSEAETAQLPWATCPTVQPPHGDKISPCIYSEPFFNWGSQNRTAIPLQKVSPSREGLFVCPCWVWYGSCWYLPPGWESLSGWQSCSPGHPLAPGFDVTCRHNGIDDSTSSR